MDEARDKIGTPSSNIAEDYSDLGSTKSEEPTSDRTQHQRGGRKQDDLGSTKSEEPASDRTQHQRGGRKQDDLGSTKSEEPASDRTKYQRGGRKQDDLGSTKSEEPASDRKKYQRGGRKEDTSRWNSLSSRLPPLGPDDGSDREEEQEKEPSHADEPIEEREPRSRATPFKTGISSFNLKRAEGSGGRPMGVTIDDPTTKVPAEHEFDQERRKTTPDKGKPRTEREARQHMEPEEKKPVQIRLDLNLMIEVFLRAKIQGDVTITFLE